MMNLGNEIVEFLKSSEANFEKRSNQHYLNYAIECVRISNEIAPSEWVFKTIEINETIFLESNDRAILSKIVKCKDGTFDVYDLDFKSYCTLEKMLLAKVA